MTDSDGDENGIGKTFESLHIKTLSVDNIDIPGTDTNDVGTIKLADNLEIAGANTLFKFTQTYPPATSVVASQGVSNRYSLAYDREVFAELIPFVKGKAQ